MAVPSSPASATDAHTIKSTTTIPGKDKCNWGSPMSSYSSLTLSLVCK